MKKYRICKVLVTFLIGIMLMRRNEFMVQASEQSALVGSLIEEGGKIYYIYPDGTFAKDWVKIGSDWYFFEPQDASMAINTTINGFVFGTDGKFIGMEQVIEEPVKNQELKDLVEANLFAIIRSDMTEEEKISTCYMHIINNTTYKRTYDTPSGDWTGDYAYQLLTTGKGNCYRYASAFAYLVTGLGYETKVITGEIAARKGGMTPHSWTEVKIGDEWYIYDSELQDANGKDYYKKTYDNYPSKPLIKKLEWEVRF